MKTFSVKVDDISWPFIAKLGSRYGFPYIEPNPTERTKYYVFQYRVPGHPKRTTRFLDLPIGIKLASYEDIGQLAQWLTSLPEDDFSVDINADNITGKVTKDFVCISRPNHFMIRLEDFDILAQKVAEYRENIKNEKTSIPTNPEV